MKSRLTRTVISGAAVVAMSGWLLTLTTGVKVTPAMMASDSSSQVNQPESDKAARMRISEAYGKLPLSFEQNHGQTDRQVKFLSRGKGYTLLLTPDEALLSLRSEKAADSDSRETQLEKPEMQSAVLRMKLIGANKSPKIEGRERLQGKSNYLIGNDRGNWRTDIPNYARVQYDEVYPGIDLVYYGNQRRLEYDFVVKPGADPSAIRLSFDGADELKLDADGSLRLKMKGGEVTQPAPVTYQQSESGVRQTVAGHYVLKGHNEVVFEIAEYDRSRELVIDPQLIYGTYYGSTFTDVGNGIDVDNNGNVYIAGQTDSGDLLLVNPYQSALLPASNGLDDAFILKLNATGTSIIYATYLGGDTNDRANAIAVSSDGRAFVAGGINTFQNVGNGNFPVTPNAYQNNVLESPDAFLTVLTAAGNDLFYSTRFGARSCTLDCQPPNITKEEAFGIALDSSNRVYITGSTDADHFPTKNAFQNSRGSSTASDAFIAKFDPSQNNNSSLLFSSYMGGGGGETGRAVAVDPSGNAYMVGETGSFDFPTKASAGQTPFQAIQGGVSDAFIAQVFSTGTLAYSTYFGGNGAESARAVAVDSAQRVYVTGFTESNALTFPLVHAFDSSTSSRDAFVAKMNAGGTALFYSSFLGGSSGDEGRGLAIDSAGNAYVTGFTASTNFPTVNGLPSTINNGDAFITKIEASDATGTTTPKMLYSDTFGGSTQGNAIALDTKGNLYITGRAGTGFTTTPGALQETFNGGLSDAFVSKIGSTFPDTIGVFHPPITARPIDDFRLRNSNTSGPPDATVDFGQAGDQPLAGDWNGDGVDDVGVFRPSTAQFVMRQPTRLPTGIIINFTLFINFGLTGDKAVVGDWDGDGIDTPGVFRNGQWLLTNGPNTSSSTPPIDLIFNFGSAGDTPLAGDWNADGIDTIGVNNGDVFALRNSNNSGPSDVVFGFGSPGDLPFVGDWNGDGVDTPGMFRSGTVFLRNSNTSGVGDVTINFGQAGDIPISGDWDGKPGNTPPDSGVNNPSEGSSRVGQTQVFTTTCSDPDGWRDIRTIDFKIARSSAEGNGVPVILWVQFDENSNLIRFYDPDLQTWQEGAPGSNITLSSRFADLHLAGTSVQGSGPTGPSVKITWEIVFKGDAVGTNYKQFLKITDDTGSSTGFDRVGSWTVKR